MPVRSDMSDLIEKIEWARSHDAEAQAIAAERPGLRPLDDL